MFSCCAGVREWRFAFRRRLLEHYPIAKSLFDVIRVYRHIGAGSDGPLSLGWESRHTLLSPLTLGPPKPAGSPRLARFSLATLATPICRYTLVLKSAWQLRSRFLPPDLGPGERGCQADPEYLERHGGAIQAGWKRFEPYCLRHSALTMLAESRCDAFTLARIAGHSSITITER